MKKIRTHYENLQVVENASIEAIKGAYKYLSQRWHPDKNPDQREQAERITQMINEAYAVLSDPARRRAHDQWIAAQRTEQRRQTEERVSPEAEQRRQAEERAAREAQQAEQRRQAEERAAREAQQAEQRRQTEERAAREGQQAGQHSRTQSSSQWRFGIALAFLSIFGLFIFVTSAPPAPSAPSAPPTDRYEVRGSNGDMIYDTTTQLEWQRCSLGQTWNGRTCTGEANPYTWDQARAAADRVSGWRLPTIDELRTLVYCSSGQPARFNSSGRSCSGDYQRPTIVTEAFPETPSSVFWSGSPNAYNSSYA